MLKGLGIVLLSMMISTGDGYAVNYGLYCMDYNQLVSEGKTITDSRIYLWCEDSDGVDYEIKYRDPDGNTGTLEVDNTLSLNNWINLGMEWLE